MIGLVLKVQMNKSQKVIELPLYVVQKKSDVYDHNTSTLTFEKHQKNMVSQTYSS